MKKLILMSSMIALGLSASVFAKTTHIKFDGAHVTKVISLKKNDVVEINTTIPVGNCFLVSAAPKVMTDYNSQNFTFISSVENVPPERNGLFMDRICAGANPGFVTYRFTGKKHVIAIFDVK